MTCYRIGGYEYCYHAYSTAVQLYRSCNLNSFTRRSCVGTHIFLYTHPHKSLRHVQVYQGSLYVCTSAVGMPLTSDLKPSRFFDLTQDSFCSRNENDFARSKTADFRSGIFRFRSRIRVGLRGKKCQNV